MTTKFEINKAPIIKLLIEKQILIPIYQRHYTWKAEHIEALIEDIILRSQDGSEHFFGIIAISRKIETMDGKYIVTYKIIDGQQRLTTSLILYAYFCAKLNLENEPICRLIKTQRSNFKYELNENLKVHIDNLFKNNISLLKGNFKKNYEFVKERLENQKDLQKLYVTFRDKFIVVSLYYKIDSKEEMLVFENLNSKGTPLKSFDLVKNYLISLGGDPKNNLLKFNQKIWNLTETKYSKKLKTEDHKEKAIERFFEFYLIFKKKANLTKFVNYSIYKNFKSAYGKTTNLDDLLNDLRKYLILHLSILTKEKNYGSIWLECASVNKDNHMPFVFDLFNRFGHYDQIKEEWQSDKKIDDYLKYSVIHLLKIMTVEGTGQSFTKMWIDIAKTSQSKNHIELKDLLQEGKILGTKETPSNSKFENALLMAPKQNWIPRVLIKILEYIANKRNPLNEIIKYDSSTIEHIIPKNPKTRDWPFYDENDKDIHKEKIDQIGNLVVIDQKPNNKLSNKSFNEKLLVYKLSKSPLITGVNLRVKPLCHENNFSYQTIETRTKALVQDLLEEFN